MPTNIETDAQFTWEKNALFALVTKAPLLNGNGSIIFNGSVHNYLGQPGLAAYAAAMWSPISDGLKLLRFESTTMQTRSLG